MYYPYVKQLCYAIIFLSVFFVNVIQCITLPNVAKINSSGVLEKPIVVIICSYNNAQWYTKNLDSVFHQNYENYGVIYLDDGSVDNTGELVEHYIQDHNLNDTCLVIKNTDHLFKMQNLYNGYQMCPDDAIIIELDGDDWLPHENIFSLINKTYSEKDIWLTYGHFITWPGNVSTRSMTHIIKTSIPQHVIDSNRFRKIKGCIWAGLRTYYAWLVKRIRVQDLQYNDAWLTRTSDTAIMFPMFEMAGNRHAFIDDILLVYNQETPLNDYKVDPTLQYKLELFIRSLPPYSRLLKKP